MAFKLMEIVLAVAAGTMHRRVTRDAASVYLMVLISGPVKRDITFGSIIITPSNVLCI